MVIIIIHFKKRWFINTRKIIQIKVYQHFKKPNFINTVEDYKYVIIRKTTLFLNS